MTDPQQSGPEPFDDPASSVWSKYRIGKSLYIVGLFLLSFILMWAAIGWFLPMKFSLLFTESLVIDGNDGSGRITANTKAGYPQLTLIAPDGIGRVVLWAKNDGVARIAIEQGEGNPVILIDTDTPGANPRIQLLDPKTGKPAWTLTLDDTGSPIITTATGP